MKIAVSSSGATVDSPVFQQFGRAPYFIVIDINDQTVSAVKNEQAGHPSGAGVQSAQVLVDAGVNVLLTGLCGPHAMKVLSAADISVAVGIEGTVKKAIDQFKNGILRLV